MPLYAEPTQDTVVTRRPCLIPCSELFILKLFQAFLGYTWSYWTSYVASFLVELSLNCQPSYWIVSSFLNQSGGALAKLHLHSVNKYSATGVCKQAVLTAGGALPEEGNT